MRVWLGRYGGNDSCTISYNETGNKFAWREVEYLNEVLKTAGFSDKRVKMAFCTSAEGQKFQKVTTEFDKEIRTLGKNPLKQKKSD